MGREDHIEDIRMLSIFNISLIEDREHWGDREEREVTACVALMKGVHCYLSSKETNVNQSLYNSLSNEDS